MNEAMQMMMGVSLAACAGLRAWLPLLGIGLLARNGYVPLQPQMAFLTHDATLIALGVAALIEFLGDKVIGIDHFLDVIGTFARPVAGAIIATSVQSKMDPTLAATLGMLAGGGTALTIHAGKAATRVKATAFAPLHIGAGNTFLSLLEDGVVVAGFWLAVHAPLLAFALTLLLLLAAVLMVGLAIKTGKTLLSLLRGKTEKRPTPTASQAKMVAP